VIVYFKSESNQVILEWALWKIARAVALQDFPESFFQFYFVRPDNFQIDNYINGMTDLYKVNVLTIS
jgi:hypothetical protein